MIEGQWGKGQRTASRTHVNVFYFHTHTAIKPPETDGRQSQPSAGGACGVEGRLLNPRKGCVLVREWGEMSFSMKQGDKAIVRRDGQRIQRSATIELLRGVRRENRVSLL